MGMLRPWHIIVLVVVLVVLFGGKRLPGAARSLGRSLRIIKAETSGLVGEPEPDDLDEKADARTERRPLSTDSKESTKPKDRDRDEVQTGEVIDPSSERVRDN